MPEILELKRSIYEALKTGELERAEDIALSAMEGTVVDNDIDDILKMIRFWQNRSGMFEFTEDDNSGEKLFYEWDRFIDFCVENKVQNKKAFYAVKSFVFKTIVELLIESYKLTPFRDRETLILLGQSFYEIGIMDKAIETLEFANASYPQPSDPRVWLLLGDLYAEAGDHDLAMAMFNEAFFNFPQSIPLDEIEYPPVQKLRKMIEADGFAPEDVPEWVPVYGYLYNALTARREIRYNDYLALKQRIREYEKSLAIDKKVLNVIIPRLVNYYLWALDYYIYQVKAFGGARKVVERIHDVLALAPAGDETRQKLMDRADAVFRGVLTNNWPTNGAPVGAKDRQGE